MFIGQIYKDTNSQRTLNPPAKIASQTVSLSPKQFVAKIKLLTGNVRRSVHSLGGQIGRGRRTLTVASRNGQHTVQLPPGPFVNLMVHGPVSTPQRSCPAFLARMRRLSRFAALHRTFVLVKSVLNQTDYCITSVRENALSCLTL